MLPFRHKVKNLFMLESPQNHKEITPNFLSKTSELAEQRMHQLLEIAGDLGTSQR